MNEVADRIENWQHFERLAAALQAKLEPCARVVGSAWYDGRLNGGKRQVDASVFGSLGSTKIWIAVDAKHLGIKVDVPDIEQFAGLLRDVGADKGIVITTIGYSAAALVAGVRERIDTCVLRPARNEDWAGHIRSFAVKVQLMSISFHEEGASLTVEDGRVLPCTRLMMTRDRDGDWVGLPELVEASMAQAPRPWEDAETVTIGFEPGAFTLLLGNEEAAIRSITCRPFREPVHVVDMLVQSAHDFVFMKVLPNEQIDEKRFFEFQELDRLADKFRKEP